MTKETRTVWTDGENRELIVKKSETEFYIPLSTINKETLEQLRDACIDACNPESKP